ncbi:DUF3795 domain-containing protein [uncultured Methanospirillum sp.]|uniref:DUF3795 domain-containing protein n=1 Tax=uncultured Methanospirillum sp. TaxID=262503 RepID=UPI0029C8C1E3|nr:DUF3795 domain-containing protein [uncultured Methanospirillum sp.]
MKIQYPEIGICCLSCRLCPQLYTDGQSRCGGCKTETRISVGCPFITCALKRKGVEFCWECDESETCEKWKKHREAGKKADSFTCYQKLEDNICFIRKNGIDIFQTLQKTREDLLRIMLNEFNDGRSKSFYCIAATILEIAELEDVLAQANNESTGMDMKGKARILHALLEETGKQQGYCLKLRRKERSKG